MDTEGHSLGTFLGFGIAEFPAVVFFWHPVMSFIVPILVLEVLTGKAVTQLVPGKRGIQSAMFVSIGTLHDNIHFFAS